MDVVRVPVPVSSAPGGATNAYVVGTASAVLVDPPAASSALDAALERRTVEHILVTHHHPDHTGGVATYADRTGGTLWARYGREDAYESATGRAPDRTYRDGTTLSTDAGDVRVLETPGHAVEHCSFVAGSSVLVGDLAVRSGSVAIAAPEGDLRAYFASLRRVARRSSELLYPGHGPRIDRPVETLYRLYHHRRDRDRQILQAIADGHDTVESITAAVYDTDALSDRALAEATVETHLDKLAIEGTIDRSETGITREEGLSARSS